ncbi:MAG: hypothetical protein PF505_09645, partial [Vallitaleaceae bacterium]|nr:hypothetical protein [Vallitaleaceae bacterium]
TEGSDYNVVVFMSLEDNEYVTYITDLRATKDSTFYMEDGFIVEESYGYAELAYSIQMEDAYLILKTGGSYGTDSSEDVPTLIPGTSYEISNSINKINGLDEYVESYILNYTDENGDSHPIQDYRYSYIFDEDSMTNEYTEDYEVDNDLNRKEGFMKKHVIILLTLIMIIVIVVGCSSKEEAKTERELRKEIETELEVELEAEREAEREAELDSTDSDDTPDDSSPTDTETESALEVDEKLTDMEAMADYLNNHEYFNMAYNEANYGDFNYDNYIMRHIDFTNDGKLDTIIVTWTEGSDYNVVVFMSLEDNEYVTYITDLRATKDSMFYMEDGYIVEESNGYAELAYSIQMEDTYLILKTGGSYGIDSSEEVPTLIPGTSYEISTSINKINGLDEYVESYILNYIDENGDSHPIQDYRYSYIFDEDSMTHEYTEDYVVDNDLTQIMVDNLIIGSNNNLSTFQDIMSETESLAKAIDYYMDNRKDFSKNSREMYLDSALAYIYELAYIQYLAFPDEETITNGKIENLVAYGLDPLPASVESLFQLVKCFYIEDGSAFNVQDVERDGWYTVTCVEPAYTAMIRTMKADKALLNDESIDYISRDDEYVDLHFTNEADLYTLAEDVVYPVVLIDSLDQLESFQDVSIWKATAVIIPENVEYPDGYDEYEIEALDQFENETVYANDYEFYIEYSMYTLVVIPQQESINELDGSLEIDMSDTGHETTLQFKVFGTLNDVELTYAPNGFDSGVEQTVIDIGDITNTTVYINADLPSDASSVLVTGYNAGEFDAEYIQFTLDDMRDVTSYDIIRIEYSPMGD